MTAENRPSAHKMVAMFSRLSSLLPRIKRVNVVTPPGVVPPHAHDLESGATSAVYPPIDGGMQVVPPQQLLAAQSVLIERIRLHAAQQPKIFEARFLGPIERLAHLINVLPGSATQAYSGSGGLFRACVELAFASFQSSDGRIFTGQSGVEERHLLEPRWRYVCFAAGLLYPIGRSLDAVSVMAGPQQWSPQLDTLLDFGNTNGVCHVLWADLNAAPGPSQSGATHVTNVIGREALTWLNAGSSVLLQSVSNIVSGTKRPDSIIAESVVKTMWESILRREVARMPQNFGRLSAGTHIGPHLLGALRDLVVDGKWTVNAAPLWVDRTGVYLEWPAAAPDIGRMLRAVRLEGVASQTGTLLSMLVTSNLVESGDELGLCKIVDSDGVVTDAVRLKTPNAVSDLFANLDDYSAARPVLLKSVQQSDPLAAVPVAAIPLQAIDKPVSSDAAPTLKTLDVATLAGQETRLFVDDDVDEAVVTPLDTAPHHKAATTAAVIESAPPMRGPVGSKGASSQSQPGKGGSAAARAGGAGSNGAPATEVRYSDLLPENVKKPLRQREQEDLGWMVKQFKDRAADSVHMRRTEHGLAFSYELISTRVRDPVTFLGALAEAGILYCSEDARGKRVYPVAVPEGASEKVSCAIVASWVERSLNI